ncbi:MAG: protein kinase [Gammaproteobacteria bacterium]|nr:protein kinase [Gammaproteobacteria bacterium]
MTIQNIRPIRYDSRGLTPSTALKTRQFAGTMFGVIDDLNALIDSYNNEQDFTEKRKWLAELYEALREADRNSSDIMVSRFPSYIEQIHHTLFKEIQEEFKMLGVASLEQAALDHPDNLIKNALAPAEILANMTPTKVDKLAKLLDSGHVLAMSDLRNIYQVGEEGALVFHAFLESHTIRVLSIRNSKNFVLQHKDSQQEYVLKLEDRFGMPRHIEHDLRANGLSDVFTPILADRQASYRRVQGVKEEVVTRTVLITTLCDGKDLEADTSKHASNQARIDAALDIYMQMAGVLKKIEANQCVFTDMKNSNWLLDASGHLRISDTKGFLFTDEHGQVDVTDKKEINGTYGGIVHTPYMNPEEMNGNTFSAEKLHAYMFGKNLYQYLTQCHPNYFYVNSNPYTGRLKTRHELDFSSSIFSTPQGKDLEALIKNMMTSDPAARLSVDEAQLEIERIIVKNTEVKALKAEVKALKEECVALLLIISGFGVKARGVEDAQMKELIRSTYAQMEGVEHSDIFEMIKESLEQTLTTVQKSASMVEEIEALAKKEGLGMKAKGRRIVEAMGRVPLGERGAILEVRDGGTRATEAVLKEIGSSRYLPRFMHFVREGKDGKFSPEKASTMFKAFKAKHQQDLPEADSSAQENDITQPKK